MNWWLVWGLFALGVALGWCLCMFYNRGKFNDGIQEGRRRERTEWNRVGQFGKVSFENSDPEERPEARPDNVYPIWGSQDVEISGQCPGPVNGKHELLGNTCILCGAKATTTGRVNYGRQDK